MKVKKNKSNLKTKQDRKALCAILVLFVLSVVLYIFVGEKYTTFILLFILLVLLTGFIFVRLSKPKLSFKFSGQSSSHKQKKELLTFTIKNSSKMPVFNLHFDIVVKNVLMDKEDVVHMIVSLKRGEDKKQSVLIGDSYCGELNIRISNIYISDAFGIFKRSCDEGAVHHHYVLPSMAERFVRDDQISKYDMESYKYSQDKIGNDPSETFGIRAYRGGDSIKAIHWKLSAKHDELMLREFGLPIENNLLILIDKNLTDEVTLTNEDRDICHDNFTSLSYSIVKKGTAHTIGWYNYDKEKFEIYRINTTEDLYNATFSLLSSPYKKSALSTETHLIESGLDMGYANFIYVSYNETQIERLREYGEVNIYTKDGFI